MRAGVNYQLPLFDLFYGFSPCSFSRNLSNEQEEGLGAFLGLVGNELTLQLLDGRENLRVKRMGLWGTKIFSNAPPKLPKNLWPLWALLALRGSDQLIEEGNQLNDPRPGWQWNNRDLAGHLKLIVQEAPNVPSGCCPRTVGKKSKRFSKCHLYFICLVSRWSPCWVYLKNLASV